MSDELYHLYEHHECLTLLNIGFSEPELSLGFGKGWHLQLHFVR